MSEQNLPQVSEMMEVNYLLKPQAYIKQVLI